MEKKQPRRRVQVENPTGDAEVAVKVLASSIVAISDGVKRLRRGDLNDKALVLLISTSCHVPQTTVRAVLEAIESLRADYVRR